MGGEGVLQPSPLHLGLVRVNKTLFMRVIKSNAKTSVTAYTHATTYIHANVYSRKRCDMVGITNQKKKYLVILDVNVLFFEIKV